MMRPGTFSRKNPLRLALANDAGDVGPEVPFVLHPTLIPRDAERLARESRSDDIHDSTPASAVEGSKIVPDRSLTQGRVPHPRHESGRRSTLPLNETGSSISGDCHMESEFEGATPGT